MIKWDGNQPDKISLRTVRARSSARLLQHALAKVCARGHDLPTQTRPHLASPTAHLRSLGFNICVSMIREKAYVSYCFCRLCAIRLWQYSVCAQLWSYWSFATQTPAMTRPGPQSWFKGVVFCARVEKFDLCFYRTNEILVTLSGKVPHCSQGGMMRRCPVEQMDPSIGNNKAQEIKKVDVFSSNKQDAYKTTIAYTTH